MIGSIRVKFHGSSVDHAITLLIVRWAGLVPEIHAPSRTSHGALPFHIKRDYCGPRRPFITSILSIRNSSMTCIAMMRAA